MRALFDGLPIEKMNTSMTINAHGAVAARAVHRAWREEQGVDTQAARGHHAERPDQGVPVARHVHLPARRVAQAHRRHDRVHGARRSEVEPDRTSAATTCRKPARRPVQELAYALLDGDRACSTRVQGRRLSQAGRDGRRWSAASRSSSTRASASSKRCARCARSRALWDRAHRASATASRTPKLRRFRYGVQVNSLGLTEQQPENNIIRIVLEMLAVTLSKNARARAMQLPAWNEALGLPRPWDQQWSLRAQQILAFESDLLALRRHLRRQHGDRDSASAEMVEEAQQRDRRHPRRAAARSRRSRAATSSSAWSSRTPTRLAAIERGEQIRGRREQVHRRPRRRR